MRRLQIHVQKINHNLFIDHICYNIIREFHLKMYNNFYASLFSFIIFQLKL